MNGSGPVRVQAGSLRALQIIVAAMIGGVVMFGVIAVALGSQGRDEERLGTIFFGVLGLLAVSEAMMYAVLRMAMLKKLRDGLGQITDRDEARQLGQQVFFQLTLIGSAMAEGLALAGVAFFLLTGVWPLLAGPVVALLILLSRIPTEDRFRGWLSSVAGWR